MKSQFVAWYSDQVLSQLRRGVSIEAVRVDLRLSVVKPLSGKWITEAVHHIASHPNIVKSGFKGAGILEYIYPELLD